MTDGPRVELDWRRDWCPRHLEPLRESWPSGAALAMVELFERVTRHPRILTATQGDAHRLEPVISEFGPLCCLIGDEAMAEVYAKAGVPGLDDGGE